jgi:hypothetical protein
VAKKQKKDEKNFGMMIHHCQMMLWDRFGIGPSETSKMTTGQILRLTRVLLAQG